jgi:hypothetical protein
MKWHMGRYHTLPKLWHDHQFFVVVFIFGCITHLGLALVVNWWLTTDSGPSILQNSDEVIYHGIGQQIGVAFHNGTPLSEAFPDSQDSHRGFYYFVGGLIFLGAEPLHLRMVNAAIGICAPILFLLLMREAGIGMIGQKIAFTLSMFWPSSILWTSLILKEAVGYSLTALVLLATAKMIMRQAISWADIGLFAAGLLALSFFRSYAALVLLVVLSLMSALMMREPRQMILIGGGVLILVAEVNQEVFELFIRALGYRDGYGDEIGYLTIVQTATAQGGSAIAPETSFLMKLWNFVTFPLPWQANTLFQKLAAPEVLLGLLLLPSFFYGLWEQISKRNPVALPMLVVLLVFCGLYLYIVNNLGTLFRIKSALSIYYLYFVAFGLDSFWAKFRSTAR